tara:strand:- start:1458 stop:2174 length:717 start_codon:yes stop_codon:yes gene_type:complete
MDKITVIVPHYNHNDYLYDSLISIVNQDYDNLDIVVIDDASAEYPACTINEVAKMGRNIETYQMQENQGKWFCLNHAILKKPETNWFMVHDADDIAYPWKASLQIEQCKLTNSLLNLVIYDEIDGTNKISIEQKPDVLKIDTISGAVPLRAAIDSIEDEKIRHYKTCDFRLHNGAILFHRKIFDWGVRFNPPEKFLRVALSEDSDFNIRATLAFQKTSWTLAQCYGYRIGTGTNTESF